MPYFAGKSVLIPTTAQGFSQVLVTKSYDYTKQDSVRRLLSYVLGDGLVTSEHDLHRVHRKNMSVMFGHRQIKNLHPLIWEKAASMVTHITNEISSDPHSVHGQIVEVDVYQWASRATLDIIGIVALGHEFNSLENANDKLAQLYSWFFSPSIRRSVFFAMSVMLPSVIMKFLPWRIEDELKAKSQELHQRCEDLVIQKKNHLAKYEKDRVDVLEHMIEAGFFSNKELVDELLSMLAAG
jgi:cytochrome P450